MLDAFRALRHVNHARDILNNLLDEIPDGWPESDSYRRALDYLTSARAELEIARQGA